MLRVTPIYGSRFEKEGTAQAPACTLVEYGGVRVLWNVGWWAAAEGSGGDFVNLDPATSNSSSSGGAGPSHGPHGPPQVHTSFPKLPQHDCLIITDSTLNALGGLPLYYESYAKRADKPVPMYCTFPTVKMGQMTLYDHHAAISLDGGRPPYTLEQMDDAFANLQTIKYSQSIQVHPSISALIKQQQQDEQQDSSSNNKTKKTNNNKPSLAITAHRAGHVVGGAFFVLKRLQDETIVVLTPPTYNIAKELHLDSSTLLKYGATPDVLVTYPGGPAMKYISKLYDNKRKGGNVMKPFSTRGGATKQLVETVLSVLRRDGHVLLPVDASGRVLELVLLLSQHWDRHRLGAAYNLVWLGPMVKNTLDFCRSQLEWMANQLGTQFDDSNTSNNNNNRRNNNSNRGATSQSHPFSLRNVHLCSSVQELDAVIRQNNNNPTCVLASGLTLDHGPARDLFLRWADNADHAIIFTDSSRSFLRRYKQAGASAGTGTEGDAMDISSSDLQHAADDEQALSTTTRVMQRQTSSGIVGGDYTSASDSAAATDQQDDDDNENTLMVGTALGPDEKPSKFCAAAQLLQQWCIAKWEGREMDDSIFVDVQVPHRAPLAGQELKAFLAQEEAKRQYRKQQEEQQAMLREVEIAKGQLRLGEEDEGSSRGAVTGVSSASGDLTKAAGTNKAASSTVLQGMRPKKKSRFDSSLFLKFSKPLHLTFEVREEAVGVGQNDSTAKYGIGESVGRSGEVLEDDYGIAVIPERFTDIVSGVDPSKFAGGTGRIGEEVTKRGFGFGVSGPGGKAGGGVGNMANDDEIGDLEDEMDEQALEASDLSEGNGIIRGRNGRTPTKVTTIPRKLEVLAEIAYVPMEGRVDARAARQSVRALQPRQVIVMGGPAKYESDKKNTDLPLELVDEVTILAEAAQTFAIDHSSHVHTPSDNETAELKVGHAAYSVRLIDTPYQTRQEKQKDAEKGNEPPEPVEPFESKVGACTVSLLDTVATGQKVLLDGSVVLAPRPLSKERAMKHPSVYVSDGEVLLTDLRAELIAQGMKAEYSAHAGYSQLVVNSKILVKKAQDSGRLDIEGPLCEDFYTVRSVMCSQYVTLG